MFQETNVKTTSLATVQRKRRMLELWAGQSFGKIAIYVLKDGNLTDTIEVSHVSNDTTG